MAWSDAARAAALEARRRHTHSYMKGSPSLKGSTQALQTAFKSRWSMTPKERLAAAKRMRFAHASKLRLSAYARKGR